MESLPNKWVALWNEVNRRHVVRATVGYVVVALAFLQGADVILPALVSDSDTVMRVLVVLSIVGLPVIVALAWAYDLTPGGVRRTAPPPVDDGSGRVATAPDAGPAEPSAIARSRPRSIAVLPFIDRSAENDQEYFADGVAEELINQLARRTDLAVAARTSSFAYRGEDRDVRDIGRGLNVEAILEGSVRKSSGRLRISAQLVSVADGYQIWARQFDRDEGDIFAIQDEIAASVTDTMQARLRPGVPDHPEGPGTDDPEAYDLYLKGRHFWTRRYRLGLEHALQYFRRAAERDPEFSLAYAGMADVYTVLGIYSFMPGEKAEPLAVEAASRALRLGPNQPAAHIAYARAVAFFHWAWEEAEEHHAQALALDPDDGEYLASAAQLSAFRGRIDEAVDRAERAARLAPGSSFTGALVGSVYLYAGQVDRAVDHLTVIREMDPEHPPVLFLLGAALLSSGSADEAVPILEEAATLTHRALPFLAVLGNGYALAGRRDAAEAVLAEVLGRGESEYVSPVGTAMIRAGLGDMDGAFADFDRGVEESRATLTQTIRDVVWQPLWEDPRWAALLERMGIPRLDWHQDAT
ncbi:MAG: hypothetical protein RH859_03120 [Longimicrobiales bacterium]